MQFRINRPDVVHETIDGEAIIVHLVSGNYYSLDDVGVAVWALVERQAGLKEMAAEFGSRYDAPLEEIESGIDALLNDLRREELVVPVPEGDGRPHVSEVEESSEQEAAPASQERVPFRAPKLEKYTDMQELVRLDPVHQVDEAGWPHAKDTTTGVDVTA